MNLTFTENVEMTGILSEYVVHEIIDRIRKFPLKNSKQKELILNEKHLKSLLLNHFIQIRNWSNQIQFYGLSRPQNTSDITLELSITTNIKKFSGKENSKEFQDNISEIEILQTNENFLILGDPGAGKTTTLKRITQKIFENDRQNTKFSFPLLIRLKDLEVGDSLYRTICDIIGVKYDTSRTGAISKTVTVTSNAEGMPSKVLNIKGTVNPVATTVTPATNAVKS